MKATEFRKLIREEVRKVLNESRLLETSTPQQREEISDYFFDYDIELTSSFSLDAFAKAEGLSVEEAVMVLVNLEDEDVMKKIASGDYTTFDLYDDSQFNDMYDDMMYDLQSARKKKK